jgi:ribosomal protein L37AE/L43A
VLAALLAGMGAALMPVEPVVSLSAFAAVVGAGLAVWLGSSRRPWARGALEGCVWGGSFGALATGLLLRHPYWSTDETRPQDVILGLLILGGLFGGAVTGGVRRAKAGKAKSERAGGQVCPRCGSGTTFVEEAAVVSWRCPRCGWGAATSNPQDPLLDETRFELHVESDVTDRKAAIVRAAAVLGTDLRSTRTRMDAGQPLLEGVLRDEAESLRRRLAAAGLRVRVQPVSSVSGSQAVPARPATHPRLAVGRGAPPRQASEPAVVPCEVCGKPGTPRAHPSAPVTTMVLCDEHAASQSSFNPVTLVTRMVVAAVIAGAVWLLVRLLT